jgi:hypothetical protein
MCSPIIALGLTAWGGIEQANAADQAGKSQQQYYDYVAEQNRQAAEAAIKAGEARDTVAQNQGANEAKTLSQKAMQVEGSQKAAIGANKIGASATAIDLVQDTYDKATLDKMAIRFNADAQSWEAKEDAKYKAWDFNNQAKLNTFAGQNARRAGKIQKRATLINTAGQVAKQWSDMSAK